MMESSSANNPLSSEYNGFMLTVTQFNKWRETLNNLTGGRMPTSRFSFSHSVSHGVGIFKLTLKGKGCITGVLCQSDKTVHATVCNTSRHYLGILPVRVKSISLPNLCLVMSTTPFIRQQERYWLRRLLLAWLRLTGGLEVGTYRAHYSNDQP